MKEKGLNILDALENLNTLVDADSLQEIEVTDDSLLIPHKGELNKEGQDVYWMQAGPDAQTLGAIKNTFRSVHSYLQNFYVRMRKGGDTKRLVEGINTIMVLVGEATKNMERLGTLFKDRVSDFEEYKQLQNFYRNRVIKESFRDFAKTPIKQEKQQETEKETEELQELLEDEEEVQEVSGVHILDDLDVIKRDHHYELFYLKNEAGNHFYTFELARKIKLACDFGEFSQEYFGDDPLLQIKNWEDKSLNLRAQALLKKCGRLIEKFYKEAMKYKQMELVDFVHRSLMALMLAANSRNLIRQFSLKGCHLYFQDFLLFLRDALHTREYQKFLIYTPPPGQPFFQDLVDLVQSLCYNLYTMKAEDEEMRDALKHIIERANPKQAKVLAEAITLANSGLTEILKKHPNGPVFKALDIVREDALSFFDPLHQGNIPAKEWLFIQDNREIACLRLPCPILQEIINKAYINEEFRNFLRALEPKEHLLYINYQDRTSWREHARSVAIEELSRHAEFAGGLTVVTMAKDTDFYNQLGLYQDLTNAKIFIEHFQEHLSDEVTGYYFSPKLKKALFPKIAQQLLERIHERLFNGRNELNFLERLNFIQIAYHFIELKLIELTEPTLLCFGSKDGLDISGVTSLGLVALLTASQGKKWNEKEIDRLNTLLFGPTLLQRERAIHSERFERLISMVHLLEENGNYLVDFADLFDERSLNWTINFP